MNNIYLNTITSLCLSNKYTTWYCCLIQKALNRGSFAGEGYYESHHILPKCLGLGGETDKLNLVRLTAKEHFVCHLLLTKMFDDKTIIAKLTYASWQMTQRYQVTSRMYEKLKSALSVAYTGIPKTEQHKANMRKPKSTTVNMKKPKSVPHWNKGGHIPEERKLAQSIKMTGKLVGPKNGFYGKTHSPEFIKRQKDRLTGVPLKESHKQNIGKALKGNIPHNKGVPTKIETRIKISEELTGQIIINNGVINKRIKPDQLVEFDQTVWKRGSIGKPQPKLQGNIFITNGKDNKRIQREDLDKYDPSIWKKGCTKGVKTKS